MIRATRRQSRASHLTPPDRLASRMEPEGQPRHCATGWSANSNQTEPIVSPTGEAAKPTSVKVVRYSTEWPQQFESVRRELEAALAGRLLAIEHIGSTSVPGLAAKPKIDVVVGLPKG